MDVAWNLATSNNHSPSHATLLIHGFGACKEHWRHNQQVLGRIKPCYAIDLIGFGESSQPRARLRGEAQHLGEFVYDFDNWAKQVEDFCNEVIKSRVLLIGNSIGGVVALRAAQHLKKTCCGVVLIDCAQRTMDDKRLKEQPKWMQWVRPSLKALVKQRWLSSNLFRNAANLSVIKKVLKQAYPSGANVDESLINLLRTPSKRSGASEAFHGFINIFDDHLAPDLMADMTVPVDLIWGEADPWEPLNEAERWASSINCIRSLNVIAGAGHCPHDESPNKVNNLLLQLIQEAI